MRNASMVPLMGALLLGWVGTNQAQETRLAVFALNCLIPLTPGLHTRADLEGTITFANRMVRFTARCFDGPSASLLPAFQGSDGKVQALALSVATSLEDGGRRVVAQNYCHAEARNGFMTFRCIASEAQGGEVDILVSIAPLHFEETSEGASP